MPPSLRGLAIAQRPGMGVEAERGVDLPRYRIVVVTTGIDDGPLAACLPEGPQYRQAGRPGQTESAILREGADRLELADAVDLVVPAKAVRDEAAVRCFDHHVEVLPVGPARPQRRVALLGEC